MGDASHSNGLNNGSSSIDSSSPFFLNPSDNPSTILVSQVFDGTGFAAWKRSMTLALYAKNKFGFVDGSVTLEAEGSNNNNWNRVNSMIISWLLNSLSKEISESVLFLPTAKEVWDELHQRYEQANGALIYQIQKQLFTCNQGIEDFSSYFTRMKKIWDELNMIREIPNCTRGSSAKMEKVVEEQRLIQLLMGLNDSYKAIRGQILMRSLLPSIATVHSLLIHEERQRYISSSPSITESAMAMNVNLNKKQLVCNNCKKPGHIKSQCYRLHGFPPDFKFTKSKKNYDQTTVNNVTESSGHSPDQANLNNIISHEQLQQLLQLLNKSSINNNNANVNSVITNGAMDSAGPFIEE